MSNTNGTGPSCPKSTRLRELVDLVCESDIEGVAEHDLVDALEWLATMLENRNLYHKKQQLKKKVLFDLAREKGLLDEVNILTRDALHNFVSNQPPDRDDDFTLEVERD